MKPFIDYARLAKSGQHVLCASVSCGKPLGDLVPAAVGTGSWIVLDFGWSYNQRSNVWQVTDRAAARRAKGNTLLYRHGFVRFPPEVPMLMHTETSPRDLVVTNRNKRGEQPRIVVHRLPATIVCDSRKCAREQVLDAARLNVTVPSEGKRHILL